MQCEVCDFLKKAVRAASESMPSPIQYAYTAELRALAYNHYRRFHPNPFVNALEEVKFMNPE